MKRGKRFFENDKMFIYAGSVLFVLLAIVLGIIMYMTTKTGVRIENADKFRKENIENTETVTNEIGKKIEEQTQKDVLNDESTSTTNSSTNIKNIESKNEKEAVDKKPVIVDEPDTSKTTSTSVPADEVTEVKKEITFIKPTEGEIICEFAKDNLIYSETLKEWITHKAIDIKADKTSVIKTAADGVVKTIVNDPRYGLTVIIEHEEGYETVYSNLLTAEFVVEGEDVKQGQTIGTVGNTAVFESNMESHLHFELLKDGEYLNPTIYLK